ncbi:unnamed protein product [Acanthoscelides obtectus]|uniref:Zinc finger BED domain-containing protein 1-like n=1 Tax=Acanthoscelides obtectus TaxID=200917 RepID=A0A9P0LN24_ACAOB|nr:unnamed protein product [Acanthoscelides obtectus]CAK1683242.1 Zinc finger BED domain-containing protein 4 [Acanthoscelides obtectus]
MKVTVPQFKVPNRTSFTRLLDLKYDCVAANVREKLSKTKNITLTMDVWTDTMQTRSFLGLTVHYCSDNEIELASSTLGVIELQERHTGQYLADELVNIYRMWNIKKENISAIVTDSGANILKAVELGFGKKYSIPCFAHLINLVAEKSVSDVAYLSTLISKLKTIVTWFKASVVASDELRKATGTETKLIQEVSTRWNSKYFMIEHFLELRPTINEIINRHRSAPNMISAKEAEELEEIKHLLRPLEAATRELCGEHYVTSSKVIPMAVQKNLICGAVTIQLLNERNRNN